MKKLYIELGIFFTAKRSRKNAKKQLKKVHRRESRARAIAHRQRRSAIFGPRSIIAGMLSEQTSIEISMPQTSLHLDVPSTFSMLQAPEQALNLVSSFALTHRNKSISDVFVDFSKISAQDLGAHAVLGKLVEEVGLQARFQNAKIAWKGNYPKDKAQQRFIRSMGIIRLLGISGHYLSLAEASKIHLFARKSRHDVRALNVKAETKTDQHNAVQRFADHVNRCLQREDIKLTDTARMEMCTYVAEIIDNAENHAGMVDWTIQGYLDTHLEQPECEIVIFNFGKSIAETLEALPRDGYTWTDQIGPYLEKHHNNGWFSPKWRECDLLTLIALQGSVSSMNNTDETDRGQGTADLIEFFQTMNKERNLENRGAATMYILSGKTQVLFDGTYELKSKDDGPRVIAFNVENDLNLRPDPSCVRALNEASFPGTIIGIKFPVKADSLEPAPAEAHK
ncbi:hypothetical protein [Polaromonas sp. A23]|uniref:hypothetical protein n=1 Tax=Polaromonas sp. A23 TaxID=1944133 RepID=UPI000984BE42|nr:hypothetical protein [Polaromonas sp. A23]OOG43028.1 hypothetical protein B0B52_10320 [Polaromonas sp. A23]